MFQKDKDDRSISEAAGRDGQDKEDISAPPIKPFSKAGTHSPTKPPAAATFPISPRRPVDTPLASRRMERGRLGETESKRLLVGREICLKGEITSCDKLVVEGHVEASLSNARIIEVTPSGLFKGDAQVDEADISGRYEGELMARDKLTVRSTGRICGSIRYGRIIIESGGEISGDMKTLDPDNAEADDD